MKLTSPLLKYSAAIFLRLNLVFWSLKLYLLIPLLKAPHLLIWNHISCRPARTKKHKMTFFLIKSCKAGEKLKGEVEGNPFTFVSRTEILFSKRVDRIESSHSKNGHSWENSHLVLRIINISSTLLILSKELPVLL